MNDDGNTKLIVREDYATQLKTFEAGFLSVVSNYGLPSQNIFVDVPQRAMVFKNVDAALYQLNADQRRNSIYLSKFLAAAASGLFDAALNYLWDETIQEIRKRVIQYDVGYFYDNATHEEKRKKLNDPEDIVKLDDAELIQGARNIGLISELGFKHLDYIRYMRNWASAAHPNQNQLTGLQLVSWLETCVNEVISLPLSNIVIEIKQLLGNIKQNQLTTQDAKQIAPFFINLTQQQTSNLVSGFSGIYTDEGTTPQTRQNIHYLLPYLWEQVDEGTRQSFGVKYGKYIANNEQAKAALARQFLEIVNGVAYIPDNLKAAEIETSIQNLLSAHRNLSNFYSEPAFARQLASLIGQAGNLPIQVRHLYVVGLVEVFLTNGNGVAWNSEPYYIELINKFSQEEAIIAMLSFTVENIASRLQFSLCQQKYKELIGLIKGKISSPAALEVLTAIETYSGPLDKMGLDSRMKRKIGSMKAILG
ncbi:MAG: hypothetical protein EKK68_15370 [Candidatus Competibacteraceae bacterium]|nr:MAG: hypothetical protein EKK68_15370 [Candidatus Competibacteraceae bacterium]